MHVPNAGPSRAPAPNFERVDTGERRGFFLDGRRLIGVTRALAAYGTYDGYPVEDRDWYLHRGRAIGAAGALLMQERIDKRQHFDRRYLEPKPYIRGETKDQIEARVGYRPYIESFIKWLDVTGFRPVLIEQPLYEPQLLFVGIPDAIGLMPGIRRPFLIDLKVNRVDPSCGFQLAAYAIAIRASARALYNYGSADSSHVRLGVALQPSGKMATVEEFRSPDDLIHFYSALNCARNKGLGK